MNKRGFEFSFGWIFSLIVGAVILFIAIYATTQFLNVGRGSSDAQITEQVGIILNKIETSLEDSSGQKITFPDETRIFNECRDIGNFGEQTLSTVTRSSFGNEWKNPITEKVFLDKYIFSSRVEQGKEVQVFVKQFDFPYRAADFVYVYTDDYCFVQPPGEIEDEIKALNLDKINISFSVSDCLSGSTSVCFGIGNCDINVDLISRKVTQSGQSVYYGGESALLYGAIFADSDIYECQLRRALKRVGELAHVYAEKSEFLERFECSTGLADDLRAYAQGVLITSSSGIDGAVSLARDLEVSNDRLICQIF